MASKFTIIQEGKQEATVIIGGLKGLILKVKV